MEARMSGLLGDAHAIALLLFAGFLSNEVWRVLGLVIGGGVDESSEFLIWVRAVAAAILAGTDPAIAARLDQWRRDQTDAVAAEPA